MSDNDGDSIASHPTCFNDVLQLHPQTPFGAMIAKHITNAAISVPGQRTHAGALIGDPLIGVKGVSNIFGFFCFFNSLIDLL